VSQLIYYAGRFGQLVGMWILMVDVFMAGPLGPEPRPFAIGWPSLPSEASGSRTRRAASLSFGPVARCGLSVEGGCQ